MPIDIVIPRLGWNMDEGIFVTWLKHDGDLVHSGEPLFSLETDKAVQEVESLDSGRLEILAGGPKAGDTVAVGIRIGRLLSADEVGAHAQADLEATRVLPASSMSSGQASDSANVTVRRADRTARPFPVSSPRARRRSRELGVDLHQLSGTGRGGWIREHDVVAAAGGSEAACERTPAPRIAEAFEVLPIAPTRRLIAARLARSLRETVPVTLTTTIDASNIVNLRSQFRAVAESRPAGSMPLIGYSDVVIKLSAVALERHRLLNSRWDGDRILLLRDIHIGQAVDTDSGLMVPVIRNVSELTLRQVADRSRDLIDRARRRLLAPEDLQGGTFTVTNLGSYGIEAFTPIINHPECAILGMGRILQPRGTARARSHERPRMTLSLTFDHRILDGAPAARFLQDLGGLLENPGPWLLP